MAQLDRMSLLQLLQEIRQIEELFFRLNFSLLVELEVADAFEEEDMSVLGGKT